MRLIFKYYRNFENSRRSHLVYLADYSGLFASCLCFIHCWMLPLLLIFLPGLIIHNEWVHPVLCSIAIMSTVPLIFKKTFRLQSGFFQFTLGFGNIMMLIILLAHDHLSFTGELVLNTMGGLSLVYVHYNNLRMKKESCNH